MTKAAVTCPSGIPAGLQSGTKQATGKVGISGENVGKLSSGSKARIDSVGFMRALKPPPLCGSSFTPASLFLTLVAASILAVGQARPDGPVSAVPAPQAASHWHEASLDEYRQHLAILSKLVKSCAEVRDMKTCDPTLVGPDDRVPIGDSANKERRLVRYGWLRVLLSRAQDKDAEKPKPVSGAKHGSDEESSLPIPRSTSEQLQDAEARLTQDLAEANSASATTASHAEERDALKQVLAGRDFRSLTEPSAGESALEKLGNWLNKIFERAAKLKSRAAWIGRAIVSGFILTVCVGLVWGLMQLERRWRIRLVPESDGSATGAASARDWQFWLEDARNASDKGLWREAIHFVYWAAISRLESKRLWPADRTRTPREYLALVGPKDPRRDSLTALTGSFERVWYGGRAAGEGDYLKAEQLAAGLISGSGASDRGAR